MKATNEENQRPLEDDNKKKSSAILNATLIGIMIGVLIYGFVKNGWGLLTLIPIFIIYKLWNPKPDEQT